MKTKIMAMLFIITAVCFDQGIKQFARQNFMLSGDAADTRLYQGKRLPIFSFGQRAIGDNDSPESTFALLFQWTYVRNHGASWGIMSGLQESLRLPVFHVLTLTFISVLMLLAYRARSHLGLLGQCAVIAMAAGASGNLIDRIVEGFVTDMWDLRWRIWGVRGVLPAFNFADILVVIGLCTLVSVMLVGRNRKA